LPEFLDEVKLSGVRLGDRVTDIEIARHGAEVAINVPRGGDRVRVIAIH
jgi:hypothetical protein